MSRPWPIALAGIKIEALTTSVTRSTAQGKRLPGLHVTVNLFYKRDKVRAVGEFVGTLSGSVVRLDSAHYQAVVHARREELAVDVVPAHLRRAETTLGNLVCIVLSAPSFKAFT